MQKGKNYGLITRSDFDGLACAVLLKELDIVNEIKFAHPKDMQDGKIKVTGRDIITNLPYDNRAHLVFDHHLSETLRNQGKRPNHIIEPEAKSAARVVFNYYGGEKRFADKHLEMLTAVDKADSGDFTIDDILHPKSWVLLSFIMDSRTGLGRFDIFKVSNFQLSMDLIDYCGKYRINEILEIFDVKERIDFYFSSELHFKNQIKKHSRVSKNLVMFDLREKEIYYPGNRFMIYALYPQCNISIYIINGHNEQTTVFAVGKSIINRSSKTNIGELMLKYGGGGHRNAGTCQIENSRAEEILQELIQKINHEG